MEAGELATLADEFYEVREARLALQREVDALEEIEKKTKARLIETMRDHGVATIGGTVCTVALKTKAAPAAKSWNDVYGYIRENNAFDILQRRLNAEACSLRAEDGVEIPGIRWFPTTTLSVSKIKRI